VCMVYGVWSVCEYGVWCVCVWSLSLSLSLSLWCVVCVVSVCAWCMVYVLCVSMVYDVCLCVCLRVCVCDCEYMGFLCLCLCPCLCPPVPASASASASASACVFASTSVCTTMVQYWKYMCICRIAEYTRIMAVARDANMLQPGADTVHSQPISTYQMTRIHTHPRALCICKVCVRASVSLCVSEKKLNAHKAKSNAHRKQSQQALHLLSPHHQLTYARSLSLALSLSHTHTHKRTHKRTHAHNTNITHRLKNC